MQVGSFFEFYGVDNDQEKIGNAKIIAEILNISRAFAYRLMKQGVIPVVHIGNARRVRLGDLESFIELNISAPTIKD